MAMFNDRHPDYDELYEDDQGFDEAHYVDETDLYSEWIESEESTDDFPSNPQNDPSSAFDIDEDQYRLPSDWQDFDYGSDELAANSW